MPSIPGKTGLSTMARNCCFARANGRGRAPMPKTWFRMHSSDSGVASGTSVANRSRSCLRRFGELPSIWLDATPGAARAKRRWKSAMVTTGYLKRLWKATSAGARSRRRYDDCRRSSARCSCSRFGASLHLPRSRANWTCRSTLRRRATVMRSPRCGRS